MAKRPSCRDKQCHKNGRAGVEGHIATEIRMSRGCVLTTYTKPGVSSGENQRMRKAFPSTSKDWSRNGRCALSGTTKIPTKENTEKTPVSGKTLCTPRIRNKTQCGGKENQQHPNNHVRLNLDTSRCKPGLKSSPSSQLGKNKSTKAFLVTEKLQHQREHESMVNSKRVDGRAERTKTKKEGATGPSSRSLAKHIEGDVGTSAKGSQMLHYRRCRSSLTAREPSPKIEFKSRDTEIQKQSDLQSRNTPSPRDLIGQQHVQSRVCLLSTGQNGGIGTRENTNLRLNRRNSEKHPALTAPTACLPGKDARAYSAPLTKGRLNYAHVTDKGSRTFLFNSRHDWHTNLSNVGAPENVDRVCGGVPVTASSTSFQTAAIFLPPCFSTDVDRWREDRASSRAAAEGAGQLIRRPASAATGLRHQSLNVDATEAASAGPFALASPQRSSASSSSSPSLPLSSVCQEIETGGGGKKSRLPERFSADHDGDLCYQVHRCLNPPRTPSTSGRSKLCKVSSLEKKQEFPTAGQRDKCAVSSEGITSQISTGSPGNFSFLSLPFPSAISAKSEASPHRNTSRHPSSSRSSYLTQDTRARWRLTSNTKKGSPSLVSRSISRENARRSSPLLPESSGPRPKINQGIAGIKKDTDLENHLLNLSCTKPAEHKASPAEHQFCGDGVVGKKARESSVCWSIKTGAELCETSEISSSQGAAVNVETLADFVSVELNLKEENSKDFSARGEKVIELEGNDKNISKKYVKCRLSDSSLIAVEKVSVRHGGQKVTASKRSCRIDRSVQELKAIVSPRVAAVTVKPVCNTTTPPSVKTYRQIARHHPKQVKTVETENAIGQPLKSDVSQLPTSRRHAPIQHRLAEAETSIITGVDIRGPSAEDDHSSKSEKRATHRSGSDAPGVDGHNSCLLYERRHAIPHTKGTPRSKAYKPSKRNEYRENTELDLSPSASSRAKKLLLSPVAGSCLGHTDLLNERAVTCNAAADHQRGGSGRRWVMSAEGKGSPSSQNKRQLLRRSSLGKTDKDGNDVNEYFSRQSAASGTHDAARQKDRSRVPRVRKVNRTNQITPAGSSSYCLSQSRGAARTSNTSVTKVKVKDKTSQLVKESESRAAPLTAIALTSKCHQQSQTPEARASASSLETWSRLKCYNRGDNNLVSVSTEDNITHAQHLSETSHEQEVSDSSAGDPPITHRCVDGDAQSVSVSISMTKPSDVGQVYNLLSQKPKIIAASCTDTSTDQIKLNSGFETKQFVRRKPQKKLNAEARNDLQTTLAPELSVDRCSLSLSSELTQAKETDKVSAVLQSNNTDHIDTNRTYINTRGATVLSSFEGGSVGLQTHTCYSPAESISRETNLSATNGRSAGVRTVYSHSGIVVDAGHLLPHSLSSDKLSLSLRKQSATNTKAKWISTEVHTADRVDYPGAVVNRQSRLPNARKHESTGTQPTNPLYSRQEGQTSTDVICLATSSAAEDAHAPFRRAAPLALAGRTKDEAGDGFCGQVPTISTEAAGPCNATLEPSTEEEEAGVRVSAASGQRCDRRTSEDSEHDTTNREAGPIVRAADSRGRETTTRECGTRGDGSEASYLAAASKDFAADLTSHVCDDLVCHEVDKNECFSTPRSNLIAEPAATGSARSKTISSVDCCTPQARSDYFYTPSTKPRIKRIDHNDVSSSIIRLKDKKTIKLDRCVHQAEKQNLNSCFPRTVTLDKDIYTNEECIVHNESSQNEDIPEDTLDSSHASSRADVSITPHPYLQPPFQGFKQTETEGSLVASTQASQCYANTRLGCIATTSLTRDLTECVHCGTDRTEKNLTNTLCHQETSFETDFMSSPGLSENSEEDRSENAFNTAHPSNITLKRKFDVKRLFRGPDDESYFRTVSRLRQVGALIQGVTHLSASPRVRRSCLASCLPIRTKVVPSSEDRGVQQQDKSANDRTPIEKRAVERSALAKQRARRPRSREENTIIGLGHRQPPPPLPPQGRDNIPSSIPAITSRVANSRSSSPPPSHVSPSEATTATVAAAAAAELATTASLQQPDLCLSPSVPQPLASPGSTEPDRREARAWLETDERRLRSISTGEKVSEQKCILSRESGMEQDSQLQQLQQFPPQIAETDGVQSVGNGGPCCPAGQDNLDITEVGDGQWTTDQGISYLLASNAVDNVADDSIHETVVCSEYSRDAGLESSESSNIDLCTQNLVSSNTSDIDTRIPLFLTKHSKHISASSPASTKSAKLAILSSSSSSSNTLPPGTFFASLASTIGIQQELSKEGGKEIECSTELAKDDLFKFQEKDACDVSDREAVENAVSSNVRESSATRLTEVLGNNSVEFDVAGGCNMIGNSGRTIPLRSASHYFDGAGSASVLAATCQTDDTCSAAIDSHVRRASSRDTSAIATPALVRPRSATHLAAEEFQPSRSARRLKDDAAGNGNKSRKQTSLTAGRAKEENFQQGAKKKESTERLTDEVKRKNSSSSSDSIRLQEHQQQRQQVHVIAKLGIRGRRSGGGGGGSNGGESFSRGGGKSHGKGKSFSPELSQPKTSRDAPSYAGSVSETLEGSGAANRKSGSSSSRTKSLKTAAERISECSEKGPTFSPPATSSPAKRESRWNRKEVVGVKEKKEGRIIAGGKTGKGKPVAKTETSTKELFERRVKTLEEDRSEDKECRQRSDSGDNHSEKTPRWWSECVKETGGQKVTKLPEQHSGENISPVNEDVPSTPVSAADAQDERVKDRSQISQYSTVDAGKGDGYDIEQAAYATALSAPCSLLSCVTTKPALAFDGCLTLPTSPSRESALTVADKSVAVAHTLVVEAFCENSDNADVENGNDSDLKDKFNDVRPNLGHSCSDGSLDRREHPAGLRQLSCRPCMSSTASDSVLLVEGIEPGSISHGFSLNSTDTVESDGVIVTVIKCDRENINNETKPRVNSAPVTSTRQTSNQERTKDRKVFSYPSTKSSATDRSLKDQTKRKGTTHVIKNASGSVLTHDNRCRTISGSSVNPDTLTKERSIGGSPAKKKRLVEEKVKTAQLSSFTPTIFNVHREDSANGKRSNERRFDEANEGTALSEASSVTVAQYSSVQMSDNRHAYVGSKTDGVVANLPVNFTEAPVTDNIFISSLSADSSQASRAGTVSHTWNPRKTNVFPGTRLMLANTLFIDGDSEPACTIRACESDSVIKGRGNNQPSSPLKETARGRNVASNTRKAPSALPRTETGIDKLTEGTNFDRESGYNNTATTRTDCSHTSLTSPRERYTKHSNELKRVPYKQIENCEQRGEKGKNENDTTILAISDSVKKEVALDSKAIERIVTECPWEEEKCDLTKSACYSFGVFDQSPLCRRFTVTDAFPSVHLFRCPDVQKESVETESPQICSFSALDAAAKRLHESVDKLCEQKVKGVLASESPAKYLGNDFGYSFNQDSDVSGQVNVREVLEVNSEQSDVFPNSKSYKYLSDCLHRAPPDETDIENATEDNVTRTAWTLPVTNQNSTGVAKTVRQIRPDSHEAGYDSVSNYCSSSVTCAKVGDNAVHGLASFAADGDAVTVTTNRDCAGKDDDSLGDVNVLHHLSLMEKPTSVPMHLALVTTNFDPGEVSFLHSSNASLDVGHSGTGADVDFPVKTPTVEENSLVIKPQQSLPSKKKVGSASKENIRGQTRDKPAGKSTERQGDKGAVPTVLVKPNQSANKTHRTSVVAPEASLKSKRVSRTSDSKRVSKAVETSPPDGPSSKQGFPHVEELVDAGSKVNKGSGYSGRRSASPKLKHSKENENRKQKSASPQRSFPAHHQATGVGQECPETEVKVDENQSLLKKKSECDQSTTETAQRGKNDPVLSSNKRKKSAEQKEFVAESLKTDSTTQKDASRAGDVEVKTTVAQVYDVSSKKKTDSAPKKQMSRLPKRSTETLPDNKTADTVTSRSVLTDKPTRKTHHVTGMTWARASMSKVSSSDTKITRSVSDIGTTSLPDPRPEISETSQCVESLATSLDKTAQEHSREITNAEHLESVALRVEKSGTDYLMCKYLASNTEDTRPSDDDNEEVKGSSQSQTNSAEANRSDKKDNSSKLRARASQGAVTVVTRAKRHSDKSQSAGATKKVSAAGSRANNDTRRQLQRKTAVPPEHGAVVRDSSVDSRYNDDDSMSVISNVSSRSSRSVASNLSAAPSKHRGSFQQQQQHTSSKQVKTRAQLEHDKRTAAVQKMEGRKAAESKKSTECSVAAVPVERGGAKPTSLQVAVKTKTQTTRTEPRVGARADKASTIGEERVKEALRSGEVTSTATETDDKQSQGPSQNAESKQKGPAIKTDSLRGKGPSQKLTSALGQQKTVPAKEGKTKQGSSGHSEDKGRRALGLSVPASHPHRPDCRLMKFDTHARKVQQTRASGAPTHAASKQRPAISSSPLTSADCAGEKAPRRTNDGRKTLSSSDYTANLDLARAQSQIARSEVAAEKEELHEDGERYEREKAEEFDPSTGTQVSSEFVDIARARKCGGNFEESDIIGKPAATSAVRESYDVETSHEDFEQRKTEPEAAVGPASADVIKESKVSRPPDTEPLHTKMGTYLGLASEHSHRSFESFERSTMQKVCSERLDLDSAIVQPVKSGADVVIRMKEGTGLEAKQAPPISYRMSATSTLTLCASSDSSAQTIQNEGSEISDSESEGSNEYITGDEGDEHAEENESEKDDDKERAEGGDKLKSREAGWLEVGYDKVLYEADATDGKFDNEVLLEAGSNDVYAPTAGLGQSFLKSVSGGMESSCDESRHQRTCTANIAAVEHPNGQISARVDGTGFQSSEISTIPRDAHPSFCASYYGDKPSRPPPHTNLNALSALANFADDSALELSAIYCDVSGEQEERGGERGRDGADRGTLLRDVVDATAPLDIRVLTPESEVKVKDASHELVYYADELRHGNERGDEGVERSGEAASVARKEEEEQDNMRIAFSTSAAGEGLSPQHAASDSSSSSRSSSPFTHCRYAMQAEASTNNGQASTPVQPHVDCESVVVLSAPASKTAKTLTLSFSSHASKPDVSSWPGLVPLKLRSPSDRTASTTSPLSSQQGATIRARSHRSDNVSSPVSTSSLSPPSSSSSFQIHSRPLASKARSPARPHLPFLLQAPAGASTSTCVGRGPRLEEGRREGLASVLPADTELPSEEPWTNFPAGNAAATGSACLSEQHDAGEEPAPTDSDSSLADIADISAVSEVLVPPSLRGSLSDGDLTVNRAFSLTSHSFSVTSGLISGFNKTPLPVETTPISWRQSFSAGGSQSELADSGKAGRTNNDENSGRIEFQPSTVISSSMSSSPIVDEEIPQNRENEKDILSSAAAHSHCPTPKTQLQESEVCYSSKKGIDQQQTLNQEDIVGVDVLSEAVVSSHFSGGSTTPNRDTATRTEDLGVTLSSARASKNSSVIANVSAVQMSVTLKDANRRDVVLVSEVPAAASPGSCLSPTDSCSDSGGLSFRSMIEPCDTQALEFTPCVYHGVDSMSTSGSSTEMIFSTSSSRCVDRAYDEDNSLQTSSMPSPASVGMSVVPLTLSTFSHQITNTMTSVVHVAVSRSESILHGGHTSSIIYSGSSSDHMRVVSSDQLGSIPSDHVQHQSVIFADISETRECMLTTTKEYTEEHSGDVTTKLKEKITRDESTTMTSTEKNALKRLSETKTNSLPDKGTITVSRQKTSSKKTSADTKLKQKIPSVFHSHTTQGQEGRRAKVNIPPKQKSGMMAVKHISSCVQDIEKICHDDQYVKVTKKPHQPVTLTSVKDSVMKFETSSKSKGTVSARPGKAYVTTNRRSVSPLPKVLPDPPAAATSTGVGQTGSLLSTGCKSERMTSNHLNTSGSAFEIHIEAVVSSEDGGQPESRAASGDVTMCSSGSVTVTWPTCSAETEFTSNETETVQNSPRPGDGSSVYAPPQQKSDADDFHSLSGEIPSEQTRVAINRTCDPPPPVLTEAPSAPTEYMPRMAAATGTNTPSEAAPLRGAEECTASTEEPPSDSVVSLQDLDGLSAVTNCLMSAGGAWVCPDNGISRMPEDNARKSADAGGMLPTLTSHPQHTRQQEQTTEGTEGLNAAAESFHTRAESPRSTDRAPTARMAAGSPSTVAATAAITLCSGDTREGPSTVESVMMSDLYSSQVLTPVGSAARLDGNTGYEPCSTCASAENYSTLTQQLVSESKEEAESLGQGWPSPKILVQHLHKEETIAEPPTLLLTGRPPLCQLVQLSPNELQQGALPQQTLPQLFSSELDVKPCLTPKTDTDGAVDAECVLERSTSPCMYSVDDVHLTERVFIDTDSTDSEKLGANVSFPAKSEHISEPTHQISECQSPNENHFNVKNVILVSSGFSDVHAFANTPQYEISPDMKTVKSAVLNASHAVSSSIKPSALSSQSCDLSKNRKRAPGEVDNASLTSLVKDDRRDKSRGTISESYSKQTSVVSRWAPKATQARETENLEDQAKDYCAEESVERLSAAESDITATNEPVYMHHSGTDHWHLEMCPSSIGQDGEKQFSESEFHVVAPSLVKRWQKEQNAEKKEELKFRLLEFISVPEMMTSESTVVCTENSHITRSSSDLLNPELLTVNTNIAFRDGKRVEPTTVASDNQLGDHKTSVQDKTKPFRLKQSLSDLHVTEHFRDSTIENILRAPTGHKREGVLETVHVSISAENKRNTRTPSPHLLIQRAELSEQNYDDIESECFTELESFHKDSDEVNMSEQGEALEKWKKLINTSKVGSSNQKVINSEADSTTPPPPPPAPVSPTPPKKYKWARAEGGIWKKVYLSDSALDIIAFDGDECINEKPTTDEVMTESVSKAGVENESEAEEPIIEFPSVLEMSKRFELAAEKEGQVNVRVPGKRSVGRSDNSKEKLSVDFAHRPRSRSTTPTFPQGTDSRSEEATSSNALKRSEEAHAGKEIKLNAGNDSAGAIASGDTVTTEPSRQLEKRSQNVCVVPDNREAPVAARTNDSDGLHADEGNSIVVVASSLSDSRGRDVWFTPRLIAHSTCDDKEVGVAAACVTEGSRHIAHDSSTPINISTDPIYTFAPSEKLVRPTLFYTGQPTSRRSHELYSGDERVNRGDLIEEHLHSLQLGRDKDSLTMTLAGDAWHDTGSIRQADIKSQSQATEISSCIVKDAFQSGEAVSEYSTKGQSLHTDKDQVTHILLPTPTYFAGGNKQEEEKARVKVTSSSATRAPIQSSSACKASAEPSLYDSVHTVPFEKFQSHHRTKVQSGSHREVKAHERTLHLFANARESLEQEPRQDAWVKDSMTAESDISTRCVPDEVTWRKTDGDAADKARDLRTDTITDTSNVLSKSRRIASATVVDSSGRGTVLGQRPVDMRTKKTTPHKDQEMNGGECTSLRKPLSPRLSVSEGFKRFQKTRGTPWGQQYLNRGDTRISSRSSMAASNWHLLFAKVTASAVKEQVPAPTCDRSSVDEDVWKRREPNVVECQPHSQQNANTGMDVLDGTRTASDEKCVDVIQQTSSKPVEHLPESSCLEKNDVQTSSDLQNDFEVSHQDNSRIETTFCETVIETRIPASTCTYTPSPRRTQAKSSPSTPEISNIYDARVQAGVQPHMDAFSRHSALDEDDATNNQKPLKLTRQDAKSNIADVVVDVDDPSPSVTETAEVEGDCPDVDNDDGVPTSRNGRSGTSAKLISMSIWDTHDGDRNLRATSRRVFWDLDSKGKENHFPKIRSMLMLPHDFPNKNCYTGSRDFLSLTHS